MNETVHSARKAPKRTNDPERTMAGIIAVATAEFAAKGLAGGRIDAIADATHTSKRMIYYYYGSKEGLYLAVLEDAYRRIRATETDSIGILKVDRTRGIGRVGELKRCYSCRSSWGNSSS